MFRNIYQGKKVLVTGHTGFKGSWLCFWLTELHAEVCGTGLPMPQKYNHFDLLRLPVRSELCDIGDPEKLQRIFTDFQPEIVFHLAAQPLVRLSYEQPAETFATNVMGTIHVLEACRKTPSVRAVVAVSSDKCYENREQVQGYRESDPMGGYDPYSASKGCMELLLSSYRRSFFHPEEYGRSHRLLLASGRAGNVIGGGDWAEDRLVPDLMKGASSGRRVIIRNPKAVRPWQHVLEPLSGYLALGEKLLAGEKDFADGWNFGPAEENSFSVEEAVQAFSREWDAVQTILNSPEKEPHEAGILRLNCAKAREKLAWHGIWDKEETIRRTAHWYRDFYEKSILRTEEDLQQYIMDAEKEKMSWTI